MRIFNSLGAHMSVKKLEKIELGYFCNFQISLKVHENVRYETSHTVQLC